MRLLVTRPEPDASAFADELRSLGHEPVLQPLLEFRVLDFDAGQLRAAGAFIVTSGASLRALSERGCLEGLAGKPLYCVGEETARKALSAGFKTVLAIAETAEDLAGKIAASWRKDAPIVHIMGEHMAFDIAGALAREGFPVQSVTVYSMEACAEFRPSAGAMMEAGRIDGVILMSPRTAEIYVSLCHTHGRLRCAKTLSYFCLSANVAAKLSSLEPDRVLISRKPNKQALLDLLCAN
ncbi:MAG: uroporphyrinogen-III synthase [Rhodomicrobium sp.]|jgi:uroporphyrinogen-III synthase